MENKDNMHETAIEFLVATYLLGFSIASFVQILTEFQQPFSENENILGFTVTIQNLSHFCHILLL